MKSLNLLKSLLVLMLVVYSQLGNAQTAPTPVKEWTFLVYLNADNNLYSFSFLNMMQMEKIGSSAGVNVVVQFDPEPSGMPTQRYFVTKNPNAVQGKITSQVVQTLPETDMGNPQTLADFLTWGVKNYPAKKYAVVVWNHGNGWQGVSYDDNPRTYLNMPMLRQGLEAMNVAIAQQRGISRANGPMIDVINFDACLMSTLEVAYELKGVAKYLVGSQFLEPGEGENYISFLQPLTAKPQMDGREFSEIMVYQYALNYKDSSDSINYAAVDLSKVQGFTGLFDQTAKVMAASPLKNQLRKVFGSSSFDLVTGLTNAKKAAATEANTADAIDRVIQMYGYPTEGVQRGLVQNNEAAMSLNMVTRTKASDVYYRYQTSGNWVRGELKQNAMGEYQFVFPNGKPRQYFVVAKQNTRVGGREVASQEALSTYMRDGKDPIVFHNQFPSTSPLIADAYTRATRGAHGMTLYSLAGMVAQNDPTSKPAGMEIAKQYKLLMFATQGAPGWTNLFGL